MANEWTDIVHLDRMIVMTGTYDSNNDETTWSLPLTDDSLDTIVLGPDFADKSGDILAPDSNSGGTMKKSGNYTAGDVAIGRAFTMSVALSRPYVRDQNDNADADAWLQIRQLTVVLFRVGAASIRSTMPLRQDRVTSIDVDPIYRRYRLKAWHNGNAEQMQQYVENRSPKPSTIVSLEYIVDYAPRMG